MKAIRFRFLEPLLFLILVVWIGVLIQPGPPPPPPPPSAEERLQNAMQASLAAKPPAKRKPYDLFDCDGETLVFVSDYSTRTRPCQDVMYIALDNLNPEFLQTQGDYWDESTPDYFLITLRPADGRRWPIDRHTTAGVHHGRTRVYQMPFFTRESADEGLAAMLELIENAGSESPNPDLPVH